MPQQENRRQNWYIDKSVNIGLIGAIMFNFALGTWYAAKLDSRVEVLESAAAARVEDSKQIGQLEGQINSVKESVNLQMTSVKDDVKEVKDNINAIDQKVEKLMDRIIGRRP